MAGVTKVFSLVDDVARYVKAYGKRSILECKPLQGKINPKEMGIRLTDGTINFTTQKSAIKYMRTRCVKALQGENPYEHGVSIKGNSVIHENVGSNTGCTFSGVGREITGHGHPDTYAKGCTTAPSILDYYAFISTKSESKQLIFNSRGEWYRMTKIPNARVKNKKVFDCYNEIDILACKHYFKMQPRPVQAKLNKAIREKDIQTFEELISKYMPTNPFDTPKELTELTHTFWLKYGKRFGVEVDTNFSNFKSLLA